MLVEFDDRSARAKLARLDTLPAAPWDELATAVRGLAGGLVGPEELELPWAAFLGLLRSIAHLQRQYGFRATYSPAARAGVEQFVAESRHVDALRRGQQGEVLSRSELRGRLTARGWDFTKREPTREQYRDVVAALAMAHGANFSVPGAGKTTTTLAVNLAGTPDGTQLLVVAPKNAFAAWDQVLDECLGPTARFVRLEGGARAIRGILLGNPSRAIISYSQLTRAIDQVSEYLRRRPVHLVLDESHKIKAGESSQSGTAALLLAPLAVRRDVLSGTPMPNAAADLAPQLDFLWPGQTLGAPLRFGDAPSSVISGLYVRTTQEELGLPDPIATYEPVAMSDAQKVLYGLLADQVLRQIAAGGRRQIGGDLRRSVMRLLQAAIDPQAAVLSMVSGGQIDAHESLQPIAQLILEEDLSPRMLRAEQLARSVVDQGRKVVIWAPFTHTIERLAERLSDVGSYFIHGAVGTGDDAEVDTREGIIRRFHEDDTKRVLVANPAAGGEGISLHRVCHDAIYVGRTYNAAHYLQSRYRIHRLGLPPDAVTRITHLESLASARLGSIDLSVRRRLQWKIDQMALALNDRELRALALESDEADPRLDDGLTLDDLVDLHAELAGPASPSQRE